MENPLILLLLVAAASGVSILKENEKLQFDVTSSRSIEEPPTIEVRFANGVKDAFELKHYKMNEHSVVGCNYLGSLRNNPSSSVAVTGCLNKPGDRMEVTLISKHNINKMFSVDFHGNSEVIKSAFEEGALSRVLKDRTFNWDRNGGDWTDQQGDEIKNDEEEAFVSTAEVTSIPSMLKATIKFGYEDGMKAALDGEEFDDWIASTFTHTQAHFRHAESLGTTIEFEVQGSAIYNEGATWTADDNLWDANDATTAAGLDVDVHSWWCDDGGGNTAGIAWLGTLCNSPYNTNLNEKQWSYAGSGFVLAHELGHNFGMDHDFDASHGGDDGPCNGQGIMSYGSYDYDQWSTCSRSDWEHHYSSLNWGDNCLEDISGTNPDTEAPTDEPDTTDEPTEAPEPTDEPTEGPEPTSTPDPDCANHDWVGDGHCDDELNFAECDYDGGDCCGDDVSTAWCTVCECLEPDVECVDKWRTRKCEKRRNKGKCHKNRVAKNCQKTCELCTDDGDDEDEDEEVCTEINVVTQTYGNENSWSFGNCNSTQEYTDFNTAIEVCCQPAGTYELVCRDTYGDGWHGGYIEIGGISYCGDFADGHEENHEVVMPGTSCEDDNEHCNYWASIGECTNNPGYMLISCKKSCNICGGSTTSEEPTEAPTEGPTDAPTEGPTNGPTEGPTNGPTQAPPSTQCGINPGAIVGGSEVTPYSLPWQVGLVDPNGSRTWCGGTLIGPQHVLTAAHCMGGNFEVVVGEHSITDTEDGTNHAVCGTTSHPDYNTGTSTNYDYAIVRLSQPVDIGPRAVPACLPATSLGGSFMDDKTVTVSGWGTTSSGGSQANVLMSVDVPMVSNAVCKQAYGDSSITDAMMCAGRPEGGIDSCQGDSGGPLTYTTGTPARTYIVGVVSWGAGCADAGYPGVYARVTHVLPWIQEQMAITC